MWRIRERERERERERDRKEQKEIREEEKMERRRGRERERWKEFSCVHVCAQERGKNEREGEFVYQRRERTLRNYMMYI